MLKNYAGRRRMSLLSESLGIKFPPRLADATETIIRTANVVVSHARAHRHPGLVIMDRHLHCQLALRTARGLPRGRLMPFLLARLPRPDAVIHLVVDPEQAHRRVVARGTDTETLEDLTSLRAAYQAMPEYEDFTELAASGTPEEVAAKLMLAIAGVGKGQEPATPSSIPPTR